MSTFDSIVWPEDFDNIQVFTVAQAKNFKTVVRIVVHVF